MLPASLRQERYFRAAPDGWSNVNVPTIVRFRERPDGAQVQAAVDALVARHEALRTRLEAGPGGLKQHVMARGAVVVERLRDDAAPADPLVRVARAPFRVHGGDLVRAALRLDALEGHVLIVSVHHGMCDGWSSNLVARDFAELYLSRLQQRRPRLPRVALQFGDYAAWQRAAADAGPNAFWRRELESPVERLRLGRGAAADGEPARMVGRRLAPISAAMTARLREIGLRCRTTLARVVHAAVIAALAVYSGERVGAGTIVANRHVGGVRDMVGDVAETLPVRVELTGAPTFLELIRRVDNVMWEGLEHGQPTATLEGLLRAGAEGPLFDVCLNFVPAGTGLGAPLACGDVEQLEVDWQGELYEVAEWGAVTAPITVAHRPRVDGSIAQDVVVNAAALREDEIRELCARLVGELGRLADDPTARVAR